MHWLAAVLIGHFLNAVSFVLDKALLSKSISDPFAFTFYIGVLGLLGLALLPFGVELPSASELGINLAAGAIFILALLCFFLGLQDAETSRLVPFIGGAIPVFTWLFALAFLGEQLNRQELLAFAVLVVGTVVIAVEIGGKRQGGRHQRRAWIAGTAAALCFAIAFGLTKLAFESQPFISAFVWMRLGSFAAVALFLLAPKRRRAILDAGRLFRTRAGGFYLLAQGFGAGGFIFVNYAISLASVSLVNALQGVQYAFLLAMAMVGTLKYPHLLRETMTRQSLIVKIIGTGIIGLGLILIAQTLP
jgi:drug/metabolite transporter (DMT)-like permease